MKHNKSLSLIVVLVIVILGIGYSYLNPLMPIITGYGAKKMCSNVFISGRNTDSISKIDLSFSPIKFSSQKVNYEDSSVVSRFLWAKSKAIYRKGFGCQILRDWTEEDLKSQVYKVQKKELPAEDPINWSISSANKQLETISNALVVDRTYGGTPFAMVVLHSGNCVAEAYKPGVTTNTRLLSWSMAKSVTSALAGILVGQGKLDIYAPTGLDIWQNDDRKNITTNDLMQMQSGLEWNEDYGSTSDVNIMLHKVGDLAKYAEDKPLLDKPGTKWYYSSGSTNIVSHILREKIGNDSLYYDLPENHLFNKLGIKDAVFEVDPAGTLVGSSYVYMRARDFARFGQLYLQNGEWNGEQILPKGWTDYTRTPASASGSRYGSGFWLDASVRYPDIPKDTYSCNGHEGQHVLIIPSEDLVITVLGYSPKDNKIDYNRLVTDIIASIK